MSKRKIEKSHHRKRGRSIVSTLLITVLSLLILAILGGGGYLFYRFTRPQEDASLSGNQPTKTSAKSGYEAGKIQKVEAAPEDVKVDDTGEAGWVKVHSKGNYPAFSDLSKDNLSVVRAHSPEVLKTASSIHSISHNMDTMMNNYPNTAIMNASYFSGSYYEGGESTPEGLQINNGKLFSDWPQAGAGMTDQGQDASLFGQATCVINKDGSMTAYNADIPAVDILKNGADMSFSFMSIIVKDGKVQPSTGSIDAYRHSFLGNDKDNNIFLITCPANYGYENFIKAISGFHLENLVQMDSGGSSQLSLEGKVLFPSEDQRAVPDYIVLK